MIKSAPMTNVSSPSARSIGELWGTAGVWGPRKGVTYVTQDVITFSDVGCSLHVVYELIKPPEQCSINGVTADQLGPTRLHVAVNTVMFITIIILHMSSSRLERLIPCQRLAENSWNWTKVDQVGNGSFLYFMGRYNMTDSLKETVHTASGNVLH